MLTSVPENLSVLPIFKWFWTSDKNNNESDDYNNLMNKWLITHLTQLKYLKNWYPGEVPKRKPNKKREWISILPLCTIFLLDFGMRNVDIKFSAHDAFLG